MNTTNTMTTMNTTVVYGTEVPYGYTPVKGVPIAGINEYTIPFQYNNRLIGACDQTLTHYWHKMSKKEKKKYWKNVAAELNIPHVSRDASADTIPTRKTNRETKKNKLPNYVYSEEYGFMENFEYGRFPIDSNTIVVGTFVSVGV